MKTYRVINLINQSIAIIIAPNISEARSKAFKYFYDDGSNKAKCMNIHISRTNAGVT
mgnify:CR=1 FL=1